MTQQRFRRVARQIERRADGGVGRRQRLELGVDGRRVERRAAGTNLQAAQPAAETYRGRFLRTGRRLGFEIEAEARRDARRAHRLFGRTAGLAGNRLQVGRALAVAQDDVQRFGAGRTDRFPVLRNQQPGVEIGALIAADADHATESVDGHAGVDLDGCSHYRNAEPADHPAAVQRAAMAAILLEEPRLLLFEVGDAEQHAEAVAHALVRAGRTGESGAARVFCLASHDGLLVTDNISTVRGELVPQGDFLRGIEP